MPGSVAETRYGRRGGGWLPATPAVESAVESAQPRASSDPTCRVCGLRYSDHTGQLCPVCRHPVEHHDPQRTADCWAGRARMARARQAAGFDLNDVDLEALARAGITAEDTAA